MNDVALGALDKLIGVVEQLRKDVDEQIDRVTLLEIEIDKLKRR